MKAHADLLNFIQGYSKCKVDDKWTNCEVLSIFDLNSLLRNVHPSSIFTRKIKHVEIFESIKLQLRVFRRKTCTLDLQS
jgi:hypothetical protein